MATKHLLRGLGIPTPDWVAFNSTAFRELGAADALGRDRGRPRLPARRSSRPAQGSSLGVRFAADREQVPEALVAAFSYDDRVLLERHVEGRELAVSLIDGEALPIVEAVPREADQFNYEARYEIGRTTYSCPAELDPGQAGAVAEAAEASWRALGCAGFARVDVMLGSERPRGASSSTRSPG